MRNKDKSTFRKIEFHRKESFYLLVRGLEVGIASGLIAVLYRFLLSFAEKYLMKIIDFVKGNPGKVAVWFVILALIGFLVSMLVKWEVQGGGSGIPQVNGEVKGFCFFRSFPRQRGTERSTRRYGGKGCRKIYQG